MRAARHARRGRQLALRRRERFALREQDALPLLRGIADGSLDPADEEVRQACAGHAASLRRALADRAWLGRELLAGLEPALSAARRRGLQAEIQVLEDPGLPSRDVIDATLGAVGTVLRSLPGQTVTLTVLAPSVLAQSVLAPSVLAQSVLAPSVLAPSGLGPSGLGPSAPAASGPEPDVELYLTFARLPPGVRGAVFAAAGGISRWRARLGVDATGAGCLEVSWRAAVPA